MSKIKSAAILRVLTCLLLLLAGFYLGQLRTTTVHAQSQFAVPKSAGTFRGAAGVGAITILYLKTQTEQ